ncbi:MAG: tetratricopeptide repeat protein [Phycisphaerales bacterium]
MARRRLNKKVALMGTAVSLLLVMAAVFVILRLNRDPAPFIADGDTAWAAHDYPRARENYARAYGFADTPEMKVDLLFKLSEVYREMDQWDKVLACWETVVTTDLANVKAHLGRLKYFSILADSLGSAGRSTSEYWQEVLSRATKTIAVVENAGLLNANRAEWEPSFGVVKDRGAAILGPYLHFVKGRAALELAGMGAVTSPGALLEEAQRDLEEARKLDPNDAQVHHYLAQVFVEKGKLAASAGNRNEQAAWEKQADVILAEGVRAAQEVPEAHIHVLARKLAVMQQGTIAAAREQMKSLESEYEGLTQRFTSSPQAFAAKARFYSYFAAYLDSASAADKLDKAIAAAEQASSLDKESAEYVILAASYQYRRSSIYKDVSALQKAIDLTDGALELPDAQDTPGPTQIARRLNRFSLCSLLARCCVERILSLSESDPSRESLLARAETAVREIRQIQGGAENPEILKWQGMLDLAQGREGKAVQSLYAAYQQIKAANLPEQRDPFLSQTLAMIFKETSETGAVIDFLGTALNSGILHTKPETLLDYGDALLRAGSYDTAINAVESFEERFGENDRSRALRVQALIAQGHAAQAEEAVARLKHDDPKVIALNLDLVRAKTAQLMGAIRQERAAAGSASGADSESLTAMTTELRAHHRREADLMQQLLRIAPDAVEDQHVVRLCESLLEQGETDTARTLVDAVVRQSPDNLGALFYRGLLSEADPRNCPETRRRAIKEQAIRSIADPIRRSLELGLFHQQAGQADQATAEWRNVLDATASQGTQDMPVYLKIRSISPRHVAAGHLFDLARDREDWNLADEVVSLAKRDNLDDCGGYLFRARLAFARKEYAAALTCLDECLKQRPIFSQGYMLRSHVKAALGRERESIEDIREASRLNPTDPLVAKARANALHVRNGKLGANVSSEQQLEARQALERAIQLNPRDADLLSVYADFLGDTDPVKAMALRQTIQMNAPSVRNAVLLGKVATEAAQKERDEHKRKAFFLVAETAFEQAKQMDPRDEFMLESYAAYFRVQGQNDRARQLLIESNDSRLLWRYYLRVRDFDQARRLLAELYAQDGTRIDALKGLLLVAEETGDKQGVKKYSGELLALEDSAVNRLALVRACLNVGLVVEAEQELQALKSKYPGESRALLMEAHVAKRRGQLQRAMGLANRAVEGNQQDAAALRLRGEVFLLMGEPDQALLDLRKSRSIQDDPITTVALAKAYLWAGRHDEAIAELRRAAEHPEAPLEALTLLEATYRRLGRNDALTQLYADVLAESPDNIFWLNRAGDFAIGQRRYDQAEGFFQRSLQLQQPKAGSQPDGDYSAALDGYLRALLLGAGDVPQPERMARVFQEGGKYVDTPYAPVAFFRMAEAKKKLGDVDAARDYSRKAADKAWSNEPLAVEVLLRIYMLLGEQDVSAYCRSRLAAEPDSRAAHFVLFSLAKTQGRYDEAVDYIDECIRLSGADTEAGIEHSLRKADLLTIAYERTSDKAYLAKAIAVYESLHAKMPNNPSVLNNLAYLLAQDDRRLAEALEYAKTAVERSPDVAGHLDTYAYILHKSGKNAEAADIFAAAIQQYEVEGTASVEVYEHLGMVNEALGQQDKARDAYRRAREVGGDAAPDAAKQRIDAAIQRLARQG